MLRHQLSGQVVWSDTRLLILRGICGDGNDGFQKVACGSLGCGAMLWREIRQKDWYQVLGMQPL